VSKGLTEQAANEEKKRLAIQKRLEQGAVKNQGIQQLVDQLPRLREKSNINPGEIPNQ
jgi:hypothetical protein